MRYALILAGLSIFGCESADNGKACTTLAAAGVGVTVFNAAGARVCDATVVAMGQGVTETLQAYPSTAADCAYVGLFERPGTFSLTATAASLPEPLTASVTIALGADGCHVVQQHVELKAK